MAEDNIFRERILPHYKKAIESCLSTINSPTESEKSKKQALGDLAVLQLSYEYMEKHKTASGTPACKGYPIPFAVLLRVEELRRG